MSETGAETPINTDYTRPASEYTIHRLDNYDQLNAPTVEESDQKFNDLTKKLWKELAVHGGIDNKNGEKRITPNTDLDGKCCTNLLGLAGIDNKNLTYVKQGDYIPGRLNFDTGNREGVVSEEGGNTVFFDHHGPESKKGSSATEITYKTLTGLGLLQKEKYLDNLVGFVTQLDNPLFPYNEQNFKNSYRTVLGLNRFLSFKYMAEYFRRGRDPTATISDTELERNGMLDRSRKVKLAVDSSWEEINRMAKDGRIINSPRYGKIAVDIGKKVTIKEAARAFGADMYVIWKPEEQRFSIYSSRTITDSFPQGLRVRETMWITEQKNNEPLKFKLGQVLNTLTDGQLQATGALREYLDKETPPTQVVEPKPTFLRRLWEKIRNFRLDI